MTGLSTTTLLLIAFLIPGAVFVWSFERPAGRFGIGLKDRALRLLGWSAVLLSLSAGPLYWVYMNFWDDILKRQPLPWWLWSVPIAYTALRRLHGVTAGVARTGGRLSADGGWPDHHPPSTTQHPPSTAGPVASRPSPSPVTRHPSPVEW